MNIQDLPSDVANKLQNCLDTIQKIGVMPYDTIPCLKDWFENDAWVLTEFHEDWIVADLNNIAQFSFNDNELKDLVDFDLNDSSEINDDLRIKHMRSYLLWEGADIDSGDYPSPMFIEANMQNKKVILGILHFLEGQSGWRPELFGIFENRKQFSQALLSKGYIEISPSNIGENLSNETLLKFWN